MNRIIILANQKIHGHRLEYKATFEEIFENSHVVVSFEQFKTGHLLTKTAIFSMMIEDETYLFFALALIRGLFGLKTIGLLFMPMPCVRPRNFRHGLKGAILRLLRLLPSARILTILPFSVEPGFAKIASGGIYDPQVWDVTGVGPVAAPRTDLSEELARAAGQRRLVISLGMQSAIKGFPRFAELWDQGEQIKERYLFVAAGRVDPCLVATARRFVASGGILIDRRLTDTELLSLYGAADMIWACYAPDYDQGSGIFGRAVQIGVAVLVREGSLVDRLARELNLLSLPLPWDSTESMAKTLLAWRPRAVPSPPTELILSLRRDSLRQLSAVTGFDLLTHNDPAQNRGE